MSLPLLTPGRAGATTTVQKVQSVQSHYPNGQPKPLANRYNQYLSR